MAVGINRRYNKSIARPFANGLQAVHRIAGSTKYQIVCLPTRQSPGGGERIRSPCFMVSGAIARLTEGKRAVWNRALLDENPCPGFQSHGQWTRSRSAAVALETN